MLRKDQTERVFTKFYKSLSKMFVENVLNHKKECFTKIVLNNREKIFAKMY
jgi:hypothetical protein